MFGQSLLSAFGIACTTDTDQLFTTNQSATSIATYQLNNATTSIPSNTYPGTASNITYAAGKFGNAASFNGSSSYIRLPANFLNSSTQTISAWVNPSSLSTNGMIYSSYDYQTGPSKGTYMRVNSGGQIQLTVHDGDCSTMYPANPSCTGVTQLVSPSSITVNTWTHVVGVIGGSGNPMAIYINGIKVISTATMRSVGYWSGKQPLIGATDYVVNGTSYPPEYYFNGSIDQVRFFSSVLSQSAITALYNETTTTAQSASIDYVYANPNSIAYYKMADATDQLGNYNGTATNVNFNTEGKFGFAGGFNGSNSKLVINSSIYDNTANTSLTWSSWIKFDNVHTSGFRAIVGSQSSARGSIAINMYGSGSGISTSLERYYNNTQRYSSSYATVALHNYSANVWYHLAITYDGSTSNATVYVNGAQQGSAYNLDVVNSQTINNETAIGLYGSSGYGWQGDIDQIRMYDSALSAADVTTLYKEVECEPAAINALDQFNTVLYTGNGGTQSIDTGFKPDLVWIKERTNASHHALFDSVRGNQYLLSSNQTIAEIDQSANPALESFDTNGFTVDQTNTDNYYVNRSSQTYVAWCWKAAASDATNNDGSIQSTVRANQAAGFSIVKYTGNETASQTVGHGLSSSLELAFIKQLDGGREWQVPLFNQTSGDYLILNDSDAKATDTSRWSAVSSTTFTVGNQPHTNGSGSPYIAYCFHSVAGYSKVGSYVGTAAAGNFQYTGFQPSWLMVKCSSASGRNWVIVDDKRGNSEYWLYPNTSDSEQGPYTDIAFNSTGFTLGTNASYSNGSGDTYIYLAIA